MEPQQRMYYEEDFSSRLSHEQEKINPQKEKSSISILCIVFQLIIACLSMLYYGTMPIKSAEPPPLLNPLFINALCINIFFFIVLWFPRKNLKRLRKTLYSCLIFISTLLFLFSSLLIIGNTRSEALGGLIIAWSIVSLLDVGIYWLVKLVASEKESPSQLW
jgi:presenilin-like A22 family membrane protease